MRSSMLVLCLLFVSLSLFAQPIQPPVPAEGRLFSDTGDAAIARRYLEWAQQEHAAGKTDSALIALERGADYTDVSSDLAYFTALLQAGAGYSRLSVVEKCRLAVATNRWEQYTPEAARFLEVKALTGLRLFEEALNALRYCDPEKYETQFLRLLALRGIAQSYIGETEFLQTLTVIMDRFPRETAPVRVLFDYASRSDSIESLRPLIDLALRRLPILINSDPELAYMAAHFIYDRELARRYVAAYRAVGNPHPASLVPALNLGLVSGTQAVEELFAWRGEAKRTTGNHPVLVPTAGTVSILDKELIIAINRLIRSESERELLRRNLLRFSGVITEDRDYDGIIEVWVIYQNGMVVEYHYDSNQDGVADLNVSFAQGLPALASILLGSDGGLVFTSNTTQNTGVLIRWDRYPAVLNADLGTKRYIPRPLDYYYTPLRFAPLVLGGPDYPELDDFSGAITERSLLSFAIILEQPSTDFPGETERVELSGGIPVKSTVTANGKKVSETEFRLGRPFIQYLDLDMDGRMETIRRYDPDVPYRVLSTESDWDGDGIYEYTETLQNDGSIKKSWNYRDGIRETEQR
ncbi:MAG: hypothetical protein FWG07_01985 [Treponema sp.]|nr:hypothetical protein [Treponema sp.]